MGWWSVIVCVERVPLFPLIIVSRGIRVRFPDELLGVVEMLLLWLMVQYSFHIADM